jgi:two-component system phosphate regulon sensor histidine kinase PhoR
MPESSPGRNATNWPVIATILGVLFVACGLIYGLSQNAMLTLLGGIGVSLSVAIGWWLGADTTRTALEGKSLVGQGAVTATNSLDTASEAAVTTMVGDAMRFAQAAIEATPNPVLIVDSAGRLVGTNQPARDRFSIDAGHVRFSAVIRRPNLVDAVSEVFKTGVTRTLSIESRVPVDRYERVSVAAFEADQERFVLLSVQDETEARMSERMRADFLANASHELRTPLAGIVGFIETLRGPAREDAVARDRFLEIMHLQADRMSRLISDLLSLSRIELNEHVAPTARSDFAAAVQEIVESLPPDKQKRIQFKAGDDPLWVIGDWDEIQQIAANLIDNALKYGGAQSDVRIVLSAWLDRESALKAAMREWDGASRLPLTSPEVDRDRLYCTLRVEDAGPGIARQHLPRLSERFYRVEETATGKSGTGLGLAIVKHIVNRHRGGLVVESEQGRGTAFSVYLPQPLELGPVRTMAEVEAG